MIYLVLLSLTWHFPATADSSELSRYCRFPRPRATADSRQHGLEVQASETRRADSDPGVDFEEGTDQMTNSKPIRRCMSAGDIADIAAATDDLSVYECDPKVGRTYSVPKIYRKLLEEMIHHLKNPAAVSPAVPMYLSPGIDDEGTDDEGTPGRPVFSKGMLTQNDLKVFLLTYELDLHLNRKDSHDVLSDLHFVAQHIRAQSVSSIPTDADMEKLTAETIQVCTRHKRLDMMQNYLDKLQEVPKTRIAIFADLLWMQAKVKECPWAVMQPILTTARTWSGPVQH